MFIISDYFGEIVICFILFRLILLAEILNSIRLLDIGIFHYVLAPFHDDEVTHVFAHFVLTLKHGWVLSRFLIKVMTRKRIPANMLILLNIRHLFQKFGSRQLLRVQLLVFLDLAEVILVVLLAFDYFFFYHVELVDSLLVVHGDDLGV